VKVPLVVGFFKPLILLPVGLIANLPYHQVESILLHELAHIKRKDYLVNLLQSFVETIFFFNPATCNGSVLRIQNLLLRQMTRQHQNGEISMSYFAMRTCMA
jgi:hypothetical protein